MKVHMKVETWGNKSRILHLALEAKWISSLLEKNEILLFQFSLLKFFELKKNFLLLFFKHSQKLYLFCNKQNWCILFKITHEMHKSFLFFESVSKHLNCFLLKKQSLSVYLFHYFHSLQFVRSKVFPDSFEFFFGFLTFFGV
jgi:hypothetical protein